MTVPARNTARYNHLINLAQQCEQAGGHGYTGKQEKYLRLAAVYREMAAAALTVRAEPNQHRVDRQAPRHDGLQRLHSGRGRQRRPDAPQAGGRPMTRPLKSSSAPAGCRAIRRNTTHD
jgi:hypothetical protein